MPHELHKAITSYINHSGKMELGNNNSWRLVLDWLLCTSQAKRDRASILALPVEPVCIADDDEFYGWMVQRLDTTMGSSSANVASAGELPGLAYPPAHMQHPTAEDMGVIISRSIVAAVQTLTPTTIGAMAAGAANDNKGSKSTFSEDNVATLMGFVHVTFTHKLPPFWHCIQASKKSRGDTTDTFRDILVEDMKTWAFHNRQKINKGIHFEKKTIDSIIMLQFNQGGCIAQYSMAKQGISILRCHPRPAEEIEILREQEHAAEQIAVTRSYKESLELAKMPVRPPALMYSDMKLNIALFAHYCGPCLAMSAITVRR
jgi:hypothetical protein